jgi:hypothetical protein
MANFDLYMDIDPQLVEKRYQNMTDEELVYFARSEAQHLPSPSFHLLQLEFERRNLDRSIMESVLDQRQIAESLEQSAFETTTASASVRRVWQFALDEKEKGVPNQEIFNSLLQKNIDQSYAVMLIGSIGSKAREAIENTRSEITVGRVLIIVGVSLFIMTLNFSLKNGLFFLVGTSLIIGGAIRIRRSLSCRKKMQTIIGNIDAEKDAENNLVP